MEWFYHSTYYKKDVYEDILKDGIKCNYLLGRTLAGGCNGLYYISLSKLTIPNNTAFLNYIEDDTPAFILDGITPIKCEKDKEYLKYMRTNDKRRISPIDGEYQYYYWIKPEYIKGIVFNLYNYIKIAKYDHCRELKIKILLEIAYLLKKLDKNIPILDYSRREDTIVHEINTDQVKYYSKHIL